MKKSDDGSRKKIYLHSKLEREPYFTLNQVDLLDTSVKQECKSKPLFPSMI